MVFKEQASEQRASEEFVDIVIAGGGMAGGLLAAALRDSGLRIVVLDAAPIPTLPENEPEQRVSALTEASMQMLANVGAWQRMPVQRLAPYQRMDVWDGNGSGRVTFSAQEARADQLGWIVENRLVTAALYQACVDNVDWRAQRTLVNAQRTAGGWLLECDNGDRLHARLLVGADGARSAVRSYAGIAAAPKDSGHIAVVAPVHTEIKHGACARQVFLESGPVALLPLYGDGHLSSLVWSAPPALAQHLMSLDDDAFSAALTHASENVLGRCELAGRRGAFPIHTVHASEYVGHHLALIGDAAHVVHPLAGQGINLGFLDAGVLAEEILRAQQRGVALGDATVLARYQRRRRAHNALMLNALNGIKTFFGQRDPALVFLRNTGMRLVNRLAPVKSLLAAEALGRHGDLPALARAPRR